MRSLVLQHPSMHFRCDERGMLHHSVGWASCPWIGAENSPGTDKGQKWWSFLLSWKDGTPTSLPLSLSFFPHLCYSPSFTLHWVFYRSFFFSHTIMCPLPIYIPSSFSLILLSWLLNQCLKCVSRVSLAQHQSMATHCLLFQETCARTCMPVFFRLTLHKHTSFHLSHLNLCWSTTTRQVNCQETSRTICRNLLL